MPILPDQERMDRIILRCKELFQNGTPIDAVKIADELMALPDLPMHCPYHYFLVPAALLTSACLKTGADLQKLSKQLQLAKERAGDIPGGVCGSSGCCGAAVGAGIFASIWMDLTSVSKIGWAAANELTARCLSNIAKVEGPRCCKRVTWLTLEAVLNSSSELIGVDLGTFPQKITCTYFTKNRECRAKSCPFFPA